MQCRSGCGACCTEISISDKAKIPGHETGKPAGTRCVNLTTDRKCALWMTPLMPEICKTFQAVEWLCGASTEEAVVLIREVEQATSFQV